MSIKEGYRKTDIGIIPENWEVVQIGSIISDMKSGLSRKLSHEDIGLPVLRSNNVTLKGINFNDLKYWHVEDPQGADTKNYFLNDNDIIINFINSMAQIGKASKFINHLNRNVIYTTNLLKVTTTQNTDFVLSLLQTPRYNKFIQSITKPAVNQASFTTKDFKLFKIPLPPLEEQKKIADILSTVDQKIAFVEDNISQIEELKKGLMQKLLTEGIGHTEFKDSEFGRIPVNWEITTLEEHVKIVSGQSPSKFDLEGSTYRFFKVNQLNFCEKYLSESEYIYDESGYENLKEGTIIFPKRGAAIFTNKVRILDTEGYIDTNLMGLITKDTINNEFLYYWLVSFELSNIADTSSVPQINNKHINPLKISVPPIEEQQQIAEILLTVDQKLEVLKDKKESFEELKKGLMQKLLTGEVRV